MKTSFFLAVVLAMTLALATGTADAAKRLGGGKSSGMQRQTTTEKAVPGVPAQAAAAPAAGAAATAAAQPKRSWMGPLAGIAAGVGLAALASHFGFGEGLTNMLMIGLLVMAAMAAVSFFMRKRAAVPTPVMAGMGGTNYQSIRSEPVMSHSQIGSAIGASVAPRSTIPSDFDVAGFVRNAKVQFLRLQAANDAGNLDDLREFTTPEMFAELKMDISERGAAMQSTEVDRVDADVVEVAEEPTRYVVSVRFTGLIREDKNLPAQAFDEMWHLTKPRAGMGGWQLSGIQQMQ